MEEGTEVWIKLKDSSKAWIPGQVIQKEQIDNSSKFKITISTIDGEICTYEFEGLSDENPDLKLKNPDSDSFVENLINLPYLHEPAILFCLEDRYGKGLIYTYTGPILIALNPFKRLPLYSDEILQSYYNLGLLKSQGIEAGVPLSPHIYAIADAAYRQMMSNLIHSSLTTDKYKTFTSPHQSILISGESGAGKTESTKIVLKYLTTLGNSMKSEIEESTIMDKILQSNPILEAFGNARTLRNDNSSRFGKFILLNFNKRGSLIGGSIKTYLLEKVRLPFQQKGERNFHIFYQLLTGTTEEEKSRLFLDSLFDFEYLSKGGIKELKNIDDRQEYKSLKNALTTLDFSFEIQKSIFEIVAGILHLGQLKFDSFQDEEGEGSKLSHQNESNSNIQAISTLLGLSTEDLSVTLTSRIIVARGETYTKKMTVTQANDARDAISKSIYGKLFDWIVHSINKSIQVDSTNIRANIGVLDIFGFECFQKNSFEQLCINYTNETLQQQFNQYIFKLEQQEYHQEKIDWSFIEFPDNKDCLDLIENKTSGIFAMLDDECKLPKASDEKFANRMYKAFGANVRFTATAAQKRDFKFSINHYAGSVEYSTFTFVEKNKDELPKEASSLLCRSSNSLLSSLFLPQISEDSLGPEKKGRKSLLASMASLNSVATQFKDQLLELMDTIYSTSPHYIRCLKPNDLNEPDNFHRLRITEQLRYGGVLEAVRVARSGFPIRLNHADFFTRYHCLLQNINKKIQDNSKPGNNIKDICMNLLLEIRCFYNEEYFDRNHSKSNSKLCVMSINQESIQIGLTKVFLRKNAHDLMENLRFKQLNYSATKIQSLFRGYSLKFWYLKISYSIRLIQRVSRGMMVRLQFIELKRNHSAKRLQTCFRSYRAYFKYQNFRDSIILLQAYFRRKVSMKNYYVIRKTRAMSKIGYWMLSVSYRTKWLKYKHSIIILQNRFRIIIAKRVLKKYRIEAKDLGKLQQSNDLLKNEIEQLKAKALEEKERIRKEAELIAEEKANKLRQVELESLKHQVSELSKALIDEKGKKTGLSKTNISSDIVIESCLNCKQIQNSFEVKLSNMEVELKKAKDYIVILENKYLSSDSPIKTPSKQLEVQKRKSILQVERSPDLLTVDRDTKYKNVLEEEVARLRKLSLEQQTIIETYKRDKDIVDKPFPFEDEKKNRRQSIHNNSPAIKQVKSNRPSINNAEIEYNNWSKTWDEEEDSSESGSMVEATVSASYTQNQNSALKILEKNTDHWKNELRQGIKAKYWEGQKHHNVDITLSLDPTGKILLFTTNNNRKGIFLFQARIEIEHLNLSDISECINGAEVKIDPAEQNLFLTIVSSSLKGNRIIALRLSSREERNIVLSKIRALVSAVNIKDYTKTNSIEQSKVSNRRSSGVIYEDPPMKPNSTESIDIEYNSNPLFNQRKNRRLSLREAVIEENLAGGNKHSSSESTTVINKQKASFDSIEFQNLNNKLSDELRKNEQLQIQMIMVNNDLVERDESIADLKKSQKDLEQKLLEKDNLYKQDNMVRLQLGKRLEQVLMDKEEALEQLELLKMQLESIKASVK